MGFGLIGEPLTFEKEHEFISSAVSFGTIQTLPDGQLIVLMADHQTAGGYPRVAHVIDRDLPLVAQLGANDKVAFHLIDLAEAEQLTIEYERELNLLRNGCRFQANSWDDGRPQLRHGRGLCTRLCLNGLCLIGEHCVRIPRRRPRHDEADG
jgi:antagonist of KipI